MIKLKYTAFLLLILTLNACDCMQEVSGIVIDAETKKPIAKALISADGIGSLRETETDENGYFELSKISGGLCKCPDMEVRISKKGYIKDSIVIENRSDKIIRLKKIESKNND